MDETPSAKLQDRHNNDIAHNRFAELTGWLNHDASDRRTLVKRELFQAPIHARSQGVP